jgi:non-ribosomal peptide synthetase component F
MLWLNPVSPYCQIALTRTSADSVRYVVLILQDFGVVDNTNQTSNFDNLRTEEIRTASTRLDLSLHFYVHDNALRGFAMFQRDLFTDETIATFTRMFQGIVQAVTHDPSVALSCLPLTTVNLQNTTTTPMIESSTVLITPEASLADRFREVAAREGSATLAVADDVVSLSYAELDLWSNRLASWLLSKGLPAEACVGIVSLPCVTFYFFIQINLI